MRESIHPLGQVQQGLRSRCVLLVDDDRALLEAFSRHLTYAGYRCLLAQSGFEGLAQIAEHAVDVVMVDLVMPGMPGLGFIREVRKEDPDLPILVMTGAVSLSSAVESIDWGVFRYLTKPVDSKALLAAVQDACHGRALAHARRAAHALLMAAKNEPDPAQAVTRAIESLWLATQPIVTPFDRRVPGYEVLMRTNDSIWRYPAQLLPAAERLGLLQLLGRAVRKLSAEMIPWLPFGANIFMNIHATDLLDGQLFSASEPLSAHARRVVLEVTERASLKKIPDARARIMQLKAMGYRIALDDIGAGYAGLTSFVTLQPDFVKLDVTLVHDLDTDPFKQTLVRSIVGLARELGIEVIAEGVETKEECSALLAQGCSHMQGFYFARPAAPFPRVNWESSRP